MDHRDIAHIAMALAEARQSAAASVEIVAQIERKLMGPETPMKLDFVDLGRSLAGAATNLSMAAKAFVRQQSQAAPEGPR